MSSEKVKFKNQEGFELHGKLELPIDQVPHNFVIFAHCFTCNKNFFAVKNICDALTDKGFGVLRFDFTGLGESEGEFSDSNFSGNVEDLLSAAEFLKANYKSPTLLIGHSLGGAAVYFAAQHLPKVKAIATLGAPSSINHVRHLIKENLEEINKKGKAVVNIGGRSFSIKKQFIEDLEKKDLTKVLPELEKSILILHSPQDNIVAIENAEELYIAAKHPKSFVSLDGADHLLSDKKDSQYAGNIIGSWAIRYLEIPVLKALESNHEVAANLGNSGFTTRIKAGNHHLVADEPVEAGGNDFGPDPYQLLAAGLAACTSMTIQMYARRKKWDLETVETHINHSKSYAVDCEDCENSSAKIDTFEREIVLTGALDEKQKKRILQIADKCPVHKTLHEKVQIITTLKKAK
ncbi:alpha/beta fold hydrolase [Gillisia sp. Q332]|uniref:bifunctional alpha/beta hydrolase/OsmC family protein n=1 Tax=Gillisia xinjiangensis TaxID=3384765 RepID=UPI00391D8455